jgi:hypothetical protein
VKHGGGSAGISCYFVEPIITLQGDVTAKDYVTILGDQVHVMVQTLFRNGDAIIMIMNLHADAVTI